MMTSRAVAPTAAWWLASEDDEGPHPLLSLRLLGLARPTPDLLLSAAVIVILVVSRLLLFPGSIWEQDEAYFAAAVLELDPLHNHPHPPWFPLWIGLGKLVYLVVGDPAVALQWLSLVFSVWMLFPLTAVWSRLLRRELAVAAALVFAFLPGVWVLSARAFTGTAASALLALVFAAWFPRNARRRPVTGSLAAAACLLVRAHFCVAVIPLAAVAWLRARDARERLWVLGPMLALVGLGYGLVARAAGGPAPLLGAVREHATIHFSQLAGASSSFARWGLSRALLSPWLAAAWIALALLGALVLIRTRHLVPASTPLLAGLLAPLSGLVLLLSNPEHLRYAVPLLAFSSGLVVVAVASLLRRWTLVVAVGAVVAGCWVVLPVASRYRADASPAVAAVEHAFRQARTSGSVVVADRTLVAFVELERALRRFPGALLYDYQVERGTVAAPPDWATVFVFDSGHGQLLLRAREEHRFVCDQPLLKRLSQNRFLELTVAEGAALVGANQRVAVGPPSGPTQK